MDEKKVGSFTLSFKSIKDNKAEGIKLRIKPNKALLDITKTVILDQTTDFKLSCGDIEGDYKYIEGSRHLVKSYVYNSMGEYKEFLFSCDMLKNGFLEIEVFNIDILERIIEKLKFNVKYMIQSINRCDVDLTVKFTTE